MLLEALSPNVTLPFCFFKFKNLSLLPVICFEHPLSTYQRSFSSRVFRAIRQSLFDVFTLQSLFFSLINLDYSKASISLELMALSPWLWHLKHCKSPSCKGAKGLYFLPLTSFATCLSLWM
jgi:hypothetical protein